MAQKGQQMSPMKILRSAINKQVMVKTKDGFEYVGRLAMTDSTMNVVIEDVTEFADDGKRIVAKYDRVLIRGSQILFICVDYTEAMMRQSVK